MELAMDIEAELKSEISALRAARDDIMREYEGRAASGLREDEYEDSPSQVHRRIYAIESCIKRREEELPRHIAATFKPT